MLVGELRPAARDLLGLRLVGDVVVVRRALHQLVVQRVVERVVEDLAAERTRRARRGRGLLEAHDVDGLGLAGDLGRLHVVAGAAAVGAHAQDRQRVDGLRVLPQLHARRDVEVAGRQGLAPATEVRGEVGVVALLVGAPADEGLLGGIEHEHHAVGRHDALARLGRVGVVRTVPEVGQRHDLCVGANLLRGDPCPAGTLVQRGGAQRRLSHLHGRHGHGVLVRPGDQVHRPGGGPFGHGLIEDGLGHVGDQLVRAGVGVGGLSAGGLPAGIGRLPHPRAPRALRLGHRHLGAGGLTDLVGEGVEEAEVVVVVGGRGRDQGVRGTGLRYRQCRARDDHDLLAGREVRDPDPGVVGERGVSGVAVEVVTRRRLGLDQHGVDVVVLAPRHARDLESDRGRGVVGIVRHGRIDASPRTVGVEHGRAVLRDELLFTDVVLDHTNRAVARIACGSEVGRRRDVGAFTSAPLIGVDLDVLGRVIHRGRGVVVSGPEVVGTGGAVEVVDPSEVVGFGDEHLADEERSRTRGVDLDPGAHPHRHGT